MLTSGRSLLAGLNGSRYLRIIDRIFSSLDLYGHVMRVPVAEYQVLRVSTRASVQGI